MCQNYPENPGAEEKKFKKMPLDKAIGLCLAHDITEIRPGEIKCRAYRKGHLIQASDMGHLRRLGKEQVFVLDIGQDQLHEDDAALLLARALMGSGTIMEGPPKEGKINILAGRDGLLKVNKEALFQFNLLGEVMCATLHDNTLVKKGAIVAGTRAIPLVVKKDVIKEARAIAQCFGRVIEIKPLKYPKTGIVITGNEVYHGRITDAFEPVIRKKIYQFKGKVVGVSIVPDDKIKIAQKLTEFMNAGADLLITTGGMSVDPDDVTRFAIKSLGVKNMVYGAAVLPGAMFLVAYLEKDGAGKDPVPVLGIPACGIYHQTTIFDLVLPRVLAGELIGRKQLAELGHGGLCANCSQCRYPMCPFGKG